MTKDDIIRIAQESVLDATKPFSRPKDPKSMTEFCLSFAERIAAAEREACAKVCDEQEQRSRESSEKSKRERDKFMYHHCAVTAKWNASAIRSRGQND